MKISVEEIIDFVACSTLHKYRHIDKIDVSLSAQKKRPNKLSIVEAYDKALHKSIASIFHHMQNGTYPSVHNLRQTWGKVWVKPRSDQEDVRFRETSWRDTHERKRTQGWGKLSLLWDHYRDPAFHPIMVDYHYSVPLGKHTLEGTIDLVRVVIEGGREVIELTEFVTDDRYAPFLHVRRDWRVTAAAYAFRKLMNVSEQKIVYHGIISGKLTSTSRDEEDFRQLEKLIDSIERMKNEGISYPVWNERCLTCPYQQKCEKGWYTNVEAGK